MRRHCSCFIQNSSKQCKPTDAIRPWNSWRATLLSIDWNCSITVHGVRVCLCNERPACWLLKLSCAWNYAAFVNERKFKRTSLASHHNVYRWIFLYSHCCWQVMKIAANINCRQNNWQFCSHSLFVSSSVLVRSIPVCVHAITYTDTLNRHTPSESTYVCMHVLLLLSPSHANAKRKYIFSSWINSYDLNIRCRRFICILALSTCASVQWKYLMFVSVLVFGFVS